MEHLLSDLHRHRALSMSPQASSASAPSRFRLLDLTPDLVRHTAFFLPPSSRLNFALTCRTIYAHIWSANTLLDLSERFPLERKVQFPLSTSLPHAPSHRRLVPRRANQQHVHVAVTTHGELVAVLPYDNVLRLVDVARRRIEVELSIFPIAAFDVWDLKLHRAHRRAPPPYTAYGDEVGLDVDVVVDFSVDDRRLLVAGGWCVRLYRVLWREEKGKDGDLRTGLELEKELVLDEAVERVLGRVVRSGAVGGAAALSEDGRSLARLMFCGRPAVAWLTMWGVEDGKCQGLWEVGRVEGRRWASLGWGHVAFAGGGRYVVVLVNEARTVVRMERVRGVFCRRTLGEFRVKVFRMDGRGGLRIVSERREWVEIGAERFARELGAMVGRAIEGLTEEKEEDGGRRKEMLERGLVLNGVHSCPGEATYRALSFGWEGKVAWLVTKQPMFSMNFGWSGERIHVATSPHANVMQLMVWKRRRESGRGELEVLGRGRGMVRREGKGWREYRRGETARRRHVFRTLPWRLSFATVTAFSGNGKWVAGAALLDDDQCCVYLRNMTTAEYFGDGGIPG